MLQGGQKSLYRIYSQSWSSVQGALTRLVKERARLMSLNIPGTEKFYQYVDALLARATASSVGSPLLAIDQEIIRSLDIEMVEEFLRNPSDAVIGDNLSIELALLTAATNAISSGIVPYTIDEFKAILQGEGSFYNDHIFLYTLRNAIATSDMEFANLLVTTLPPARFPDDLADNYWWDDALILATTLHLIWYFFSALGPGKQEALLQHYLYRSLIVGVPVRQKLADALNVMADIDTLSTLYNIFIKAMLGSDESVPLDKEAAAGKKLADIYKEYLTKVYTEEISVLAQEKFIAELYAGNSVEDWYIAWLREALSIFFHLKKQDII